MSGSMTSSEAAAELGVTASHVGWLVRQGRLVGERRGRALLVSRESLDELLAARDREAGWVSYVEAGRIAGVSHHAVWRAIRAGELTSRDRYGSRPCLRRDDVQLWADDRAERARRAAEALKEARDAEAARRRASGPPDDGEVWLDTVTAALVLRLSPAGVRYRAHQGLLPHERRGGKLWFRRAHVEQVAAARAWLAARG